MNYQEAEKIRKKGFSQTMTDKLLGGQGIRQSFKSTLSERSKAKAKGIKQKFDPLNIAKMMTFGSKLGPALLGKMTGRSQEDIEFFAGKKEKKDDGAKLGKTAAISGVAVDFATEILGEIYKLLQQIEEDKKLAQEHEQNYEEERQDEEDTRNDALIKALTGRVRKKPSRREEAERKKTQVKEKKAAKKQEEAKSKARPTEKAPEAKPAPKAPEAKPAPRAPEAKPTTARPSAKAPEVKPSTIPSGPTAAIPTAAKAAGAAIVAGGLLMPSETVAASIDKASKEVGVEKPLMYAMAKQESGFRADAAAGTSSAKGLYQFIKGTWKTMVEKYGSKYPILKQRGPEDPDANAIAGALFIKENSDYLKKYNIPVNATTIYAAHFLGPGGAKILLTANPNANAAQLMPAPAAANKFIFYDKTTGQPRTVQQVINVLFEKVGKFETAYAERLNGTTGSTTLAASDQTKSTKLASVSQENVGLKSDINATKSKQINNTTNTSVQSQQSQPTTVASVDDRPAHIKKQQA